MHLKSSKLLYSEREHEKLLKSFCEDNKHNFILPDEDELGIDHMLAKLSMKERVVRNLLTPASSRRFSLKTINRHIVKCAVTTTHCHNVIL